MTPTQLPDGRWSIVSFDDLSPIQAVDLCRQLGIKHLVWLSPLDRGLMAWVGNFGITFQVGDDVQVPVLATQVLVVGEV